MQGLTDTESTGTFCLTVSRRRVSNMQGMQELHASKCMPYVTVHNAINPSVNSQLPLLPCTRCECLFLAGLLSLVHYRHWHSVTHVRLVLCFCMLTWVPGSGFEQVSSLLLFILDNSDHWNLRLHRSRLEYSCSDSLGLATPS